MILELCTSYEGSIVPGRFESPRPVEDELKMGTDFFYAIFVSRVQNILAIVFSCHCSRIAFGLCLQIFLLQEECDNPGDLTYLTYISLLPCF